MPGNGGGETPIIITDGSLTMESAVPWTDFTGSDSEHTLTHPHGDKSVRQVSVTISGQNQIVPVDGQKCHVAVQYGPTAVTVTTGPDGKGLDVSTDFASFQRDQPNLMAHKDKGHKISHVTVSSGDKKRVDQSAAGGTRIEIAYHTAGTRPA